MRRFKDILSLIAEAKFEPGGPDVGKLFGKRGKYAPEKAKWIEPTALQRMRGIRPDLGEPIQSAIHRDDTNKPPSKKVVLFTNNLHHSVIGNNNKKILEMLRGMQPKFVEHSNRLTGEHASNISNDSTEYSRRRSAHGVVDSHFSNLQKQIIESSKNGVLPNHKKFGPTKIKEFSTVQDFPGTKTLSIHFKPFKTHVESTEQIKVLLDHLSRHTGHEWYLHPDSGDWMVGRADSPLILATDINHPDLGDPGDDDKGNEPQTPNPPESGGRAPTRPRMPSLV